MCFDTAQLPAFTIADVYRQNLVITNDKYPMEVSDEKRVMIQSAIVDVGTEGASFVTDGKNNVPEEILHTGALQCMGGLEKHIYIIVQENVDSHITAENLTFLDRMLTACKLSLKDVAIINEARNVSTDWTMLQKPGKIMLLFGIEPACIKITVSKETYFEVYEWRQMQIMYAPKIEKFRIGNDGELKLLKSKLWLCLQQLFLSQ